VVLPCCCILVPAVCELSCLMQQMRSHQLLLHLVERRLPLSTKPVLISWPCWQPTSYCRHSFKHTLILTHSFLAQYILFEQALLRLAASPGDKVCRRALRLFADKAAGLPAEMEHIAHLPGLSNKDKEIRAHSLALAALQVCVCHLVKVSSKSCRYGMCHLVKILSRSQSYGFQSSGSGKVLDVNARLPLHLGD